MGMEMQVNTLEEMCDLMCDNAIPEKSEYWIFTFGCGQEHAGKCVRIKGSFAEARAKMIERYGINWAFQYSTEEWEKYKNDPNRWWKMEEEIEVIE